ncbi:MAG TPA: 30S ribosomal protein S20 [Patescibacteria group bacterium]|nr:30S ribosomal protein S20 [Patescibacteria group bacterium]
MPLLKHAKKKQRQDTARERAQRNIRVRYRELIKKAKENPSQDAVSAAFKAIDKAAKKNLIHDNKAARLKSTLSKATNGKAAAPKAAAKSAAKSAAKKAPSKKTSSKK